MALIVGILLICALGGVHYLGLMAIRQGTPRGKERPHASILSVYVGLVLLHVAEIALFAGVYWVLQRGGWFGQLEHLGQADWTGYLYFSGMTFATLGYTDIQTDGPIRLIAMLQSLGGFMVLTWSATFIYSVWGQRWTR